MTGRLEFALQIAVVLLAMAAPTLFFLALGWVLEYLRDDELIERVQANASPGASPTRPSTDVVGGADGAAATDIDGGVVCDRCGVANMADATYCQQCLRKLPAE